MYSDFYKQYQEARNLAWEVILKNNINALPVNVLDLCYSLGIPVYSYQSAAELLNYLDVDINNNEGVSAIVNGHPVIFHDNTIKPFGRRRFTVSHELGHILLGHIKDGDPKFRITYWNHGEANAPDNIEKLANVFASRLLAPACVLKELNVHTVKELMSITGLSHRAAEIRLERLNKLRKRDKFYLHPLEAQVKQQFKGFIDHF